jgi:hypothetical protein
MAVSITDYSSLLAASADWLNRGDLVDQLPAFVTLSEAQFNREMRLRDMMVRADATSDEENVALPDDWLEHYSLVVAPGGVPRYPPLRYMSEKETNELKQGGIAGPVVGYTVVGNAIELVPAPGADVDLKMVYYQRIPSLNATTQPTNWLLMKSPDLYLYATLMQAQPYLKDDARLQIWSQMRAGLLEQMRLESEASLRPRSGMTAMARAF